MSDMERILILDGHTNQALACVRSLGEAGYQVLVASHQRFPLGKWSRHCRRSFRLVEQSVEAFASLREWASRQGVSIVLPLTERSCVLCNAERDKWEEAGMIIGCGVDEMLINAFDKAKTIIHAKACGVRTPPTLFPNSLMECLAAADDLGFPLIVKARSSNAWDGATFSPNLPPAYVNNGDDLANAVEARRQANNWPLIQGFVPGQGKGVFALCDHGRVVAWFAHERLRDTKPTGSSSSLRRSIRLEPRLREPAERLLSEMKWHGPAMVEFKDDGINQPCLMEVNGRFWGSLQLAIDAGVNFPLLWVSALKGETTATPPVYTEGLALRWLWGDVKRFIRILRGVPRGFPGTYPTIRHGIKELLGPQPVGTRLEMWRISDPLPAVGEWSEAIRELLAWRGEDGEPRPGRNLTNEPHRRAMTHETRSVTIPSASNESGRESVVIREATANEMLRWDELVTRFDNHRVSHTLAWMRSLETSVKGKPLYLLYEKNGQPVGCLPGFLVNIGPLRLFGSPLQGWQTVSMGPAFDSSLVSTQELMAPLIAFLEKCYGVHHIEMVSSNLDQQTMKSLSFNNESLPTYRANLFPGDENRVMKLMKDSAKRNVRRAIKLGLVVRFEEDEGFVEEHYDQLREVFARGGNTVPFGKKRALEFFRNMKAGGNLLAASVYLPDSGQSIATGMFTVEGRELLLWMWTHRTRYRWYRPTELLTWTVMRKAMEMGCDTFDFMGRGDFKAKFGAELDASKFRWVWSRYAWLANARNLAGRSYKWQQAFRGRIIRRAMFRKRGEAEAFVPGQQQSRAGQQTRAAGN